ncbi:MAG: hypothetical protein CVU22_01005 [Betaproteobacteria bacterium HGW-Betaproteobacteria-16]|nr:MAG: hypothetical protein CVU22_01005 [Betaproteobacteria bacterium HGW-Betaproteobacteria-16]
MNQTLPTSTTGAQLLVSRLRTHGTDPVFCLLGQRYLAVFAALCEGRDQVRHVNCGHERDAVKLSGAQGQKVTHTAHFSETLVRYVQGGEPSLIELKAEATTPTSTRARVRSATLKAKAIDPEKA